MQLYYPFTLSLQHIGFERQHYPLWENISCDIQPGDLVAVRGENGSGKTTLLRVMAGLLEPHVGTIYWQNKSLATELHHYQQHIHYLGHLNGIKMNLTVAETIRLTAALFNKKISSSELISILQQVGLRMHQHALTNNLSAGQLRRLSLTKLFFARQPLWILDEPTSSLDSHAQALVENLLDEHIKQGGAAIIATHVPLKREENKTLYLGRRYD